jgi:hypothetical protein
MGSGGWNRARTGGNGRGLEARTRGTRCGLFARPRMREHTHRARTGRKGRGLQARMRGTGRRLFARPRLWAHTRQAQTQVNGRRWVGSGVNTMSSRGRKAICAQPLRWGHVSGRRRVRERARVAGGRAHVGAEGAHAATGAGGINYPSHNFIFANLFSRSAPCPNTPNALCKELWCGRLALKLVGGGLCSLLSFR